jgi:hypothetical protein
MNPIEMAFSKLKALLRQEPAQISTASSNASAAYSIASCHTSAQTSSMPPDTNGYRENALVHELAIICGACLLSVLWLVDYQRGAITLRHGDIAVGVLILGLLVVSVAQVTISASPLALASAMLSSDVQPFNREKATYTTIMGLRSLTSVLCMSYGRSATSLLLASNFIILTLFSRMLNLRSWSPLLFFHLQPRCHGDQNGISH